MKDMKSEKTKNGKTKTRNGNLETNYFISKNLGCSPREKRTNETYQKKSNMIIWKYKQKTEIPLPQTYCFIKKIDDWKMKNLTWESEQTRTKTQIRKMKKTGKSHLPTKYVIRKPMKKTWSTKSKIDNNEILGMIK